jgi:hypothetical protein
MNERVCSCARHIAIDNHFAPAWRETHGDQVANSLANAQIVAHPPSIGGCHEYILQFYAHNEALQCKLMAWYREMLYLASVNGPSFRRGTLNPRAEGVSTEETMAKNPYLGRVKRHIAGWFGQTLSTSTLEPWTVSLGRQAGSIDVRCDLLTEDTRWCTPEDTENLPLGGLLYFNMAFKQHGSARLMSTDVEIALKDPLRKEIVYVDKTLLGSEVLEPHDAPTQEVSKTRAGELKPEGQSGLGGGSVGSASYEQQIKSHEEQTWSFSSDHRNSEYKNRVTFSWRRTSPADEMDSTDLMMVPFSSVAERTKISFWKSSLASEQSCISAPVMAKSSDVGSVPVRDNDEWRYVGSSVRIDIGV